MSQNRLHAGVALASFLGLASAGCGLVSSDVTTVTYAMPKKSYKFDTASSGWKAPPGTYPAISCGPGGVVADCCQGLPGASVDCATTPLVCDQGVCTLQFDVSVAQAVDLRNEIPALSGLSSQAVADIYISKLQYDVNNMMNIAMPEVDLYLAPQDVTSASDPAAAKFATIPSVGAMSMGQGDAVLESNSRQVFSPYAHQFGTPFNFIARATVKVPPGSPAPTGSATVGISGTIAATPSL
jgi:hypothetical protein